MKKILVFCFTMCFAVSVYAADGDYPQSGIDRRATNFGSLADIKNKDGEPLFKLGLPNHKLKKKRKSKGGSYKTCMWKAAIKALEAKPIIVSDSRGGLLSTDWFEEANIANERRRINVVISGGGKSASLSVTVLKQTFANGMWRDAGQDEHTSKKVLDQIQTTMKDNECNNEDKGQ